MDLNFNAELKTTLVSIVHKFLRNKKTNLSEYIKKSSFKPLNRSFSITDYSGVSKVLPLSISNEIEPSN